MRCVLTVVQINGLPAGNYTLDAFVFDLEGPAGATVRVGLFSGASAPIFNTAVEVLPLLPVTPTLGNPRATMQFAAAAGATYHVLVQDNSTANVAVINGLRIARIDTQPPTLLCTAQTLVADAGCLVTIGALPVTVTDDCALRSLTDPTVLDAVVVTDATGTQTLPVPGIIGAIPVTALSAGAYPVLGCTGGPAGNAAALPLSFMVTRNVVGPFYGTIALDAFSAAGAVIGVSLIDAPTNVSCGCPFDVHVG